MSRPGSTLLQEAAQPTEHLYDSIGPGQAYSAPTPTQGESVRRPRYAEYLMLHIMPGFNVSVSQYTHGPVRKWSPQYVSPPPTTNHYILAPATVTASPVSQVTTSHLFFTSTCYIFPLIYNQISLPRWSNRNCVREMMYVFLC